MPVLAARAAAARLLQRQPRRSRRPGGSLRGLKHYHGNQLIEEVDTYDLLLHGLRGDLQRLENGDTLLVPPIGPQVTVEGMVRRPAIYELHGEKTLEDVLELAGGILPAMQSA